MANMVHNILEVEGATGELNKLIDFVGMDLDFAKIEPMPEQIRENLNKGLKTIDVNGLQMRVRSSNDPDAYKESDDWVGAHWGTHNSASYLTRETVTTVTDCDRAMSPLDFVVGDGTVAKVEGILPATDEQRGSHDEHVKVTYSFDTRWSSARPVMKKLSARFPALTFSYSWHGEFPEMTTANEHRFIAGEYRSRCDKCHNKAIPETHDLFAGYAWHFCDEHKVAWCAGKHWGDDAAGRNELAEFRERFGDDVTLASLSHSWQSVEPGCYEVRDYDYLRQTLVHLLEAGQDAVDPAKEKKGVAEL